jgi:hypothetical protein
MLLQDIQFLRAPGLVSVPVGIWKCLAFYISIFQLVCIHIIVYYKCRYNTPYFDKQNVATCNHHAVRPSLYPLFKFEYRNQTFRKFVRKNMTPEPISTEYLINQSHRSRSHITTDGQSASWSWYLATFGSGYMLHLFE